MSSRTIKDLPLYSNNRQLSNSKEIWLVVENPNKSQFQQGVTSFREGVFDLIKSVQQQKQNTIEYYSNTRSNLNSQVNKLSLEYNVLPKVVFISLSGLSGLLIGYKRSAFRKFLYSTALATGAAALCYPKEAKEYSNHVYGCAKQTSYDLYRQYIWPDEEEQKRANKLAKKSVEQKLIDSKDTIVKLDNDSIRSAKTSKEIKGDKGQASDVDKDMYTTRSK
jgi:hypothetical protein